MATKLNVADLDFDTIKSNLKDFLRNQDQFSDFDFEGSGINILLDVLAYNTHYNSFYLNMIANEMFLESSSLRQSVVSHAKLLGYTPRSYVASQAKVNLTITKQVSDTSTSLTLPRFTSFTSQSNGGASYTFLTTDTQTVANVGTTFTFSNVIIKEGSTASFVYTVDNNTNPTQYFDIPDTQVDTSTIRVIVQKSSGELTQNTYSLATDTTDVSTDSLVYYLEESLNGTYRIYFGDNIFGKKLDNGNLVIISYIKTSGDFANGLRVFKLTDQLLNGSVPSVTTVINSAGGSISELAEEIKFSAPKSFLTNNRAVTKNDYISLINKRFPYFDSVNVWGGEENIPPEYGKIFISIKPKYGYEVTVEQKEALISDVIKPISMMTVVPEFVDVDYNNLIIQATVNYDPRKTSYTAAVLQSNIRSRISQFTVNELNTFNSKFKLSKLLSWIDNYDDSIISSTVDVSIQKKITPVLGSSGTYKLNYNTPLRKSSDPKEKIFSSPGFFQEDISGVTRTVFIEEVPQSESGIESILIKDSGRAYTKTPNLVIRGDGIGAEAEAIIVNGRLTKVNMIKRGSGYSSANILVANEIGDTTGVGAVLEASILSKTGTLRSFYYDQNGVKKVLNDNIGDIDYVNGIITINNLNASDIDSSIKTLSIYAKPNTLSFKSERDSIISLDTFDPNSISVKVEASS